MPVDYRRNQGPEDSKNYRLYSEHFNRSYNTTWNNILSSNEFRKDGRRVDEHRKLFLKTGIVTQAKGSAYIEYDNTKVIVSVFEPREIPRISEFSPLGELYCEFKYAPFSCLERRGHQMDAEEKDLSGIMKRALEPAVCRAEFPNCQVDIYALVVENDGSCISAAIMAAGLALADASIPMYDVISSVTVGVSNNMIFVDPTAEEEKFCRSFASVTDQFGVFTLSYLLELDQVSNVSLVGALNLAKTTQCIDLAIGLCGDLVLLTKQTLLKNVKGKLETSNNTN